MNWTFAKQLREQRARLWEEAKAVMDVAQNEKRRLTPEETAKFDALDADIEKLGKEIEQAERAEARDRDLSAPLREIPRPQPGSESAGQEGPEDPQLENRAFNLYLRFGYSALNEEHRQVLQRRRVRLSQQELAGFGFSAKEIRALSVGVDAGGGFITPTAFQAELIRALKEFGGMRTPGFARILQTASGQDIEWPNVDDTAATGELVAEAATATEDVSTPFALVTLKAYRYSSKYIKVSMELLQDAAFDVESEIRGMFVDRVGRIVNTHATTGDGTAKPKGIITEAGLGKTGAAGQVTSIIYDDLVDLEHSVDPAYRRDPSVRWMMSDAMLKVIKKLKDGQGRPLWVPGLTAAEPSTILNYPYIINQDVAVPAASAKSLFFGAGRYYILRDVLDFMLIRLNERFIEFGQVAFVGFARFDSRATIAAPLKVYAHPAA